MADYLVPSHPVAWANFHIPPIGVSHAVNAVTCLEATDLQPERLMSPFFKPAAQKPD